MNKFWLNGSLVVSMLGLIGLLGLADGLLAQAHKGGAHPKGGKGGAAGGQKGGKGGGGAAGVAPLAGGGQHGLGGVVSALAKQGIKGNQLANLIHQMHRNQGGLGKGKGGAPAQKKAGNAIPGNQPQQAAPVGPKGGKKQKNQGAPAGNVNAGRGNPLAPAAAIGAGGGKHRQLPGGVPAPNIQRQRR